MRAALYLDASEGWSPLGKSKNRIIFIEKNDHEDKTQPGFS